MYPAPHGPSRSILGSTTDGDRLNFPPSRPRPFPVKTARLLALAILFVPATALLAADAAAPAPAAAPASEPTWFSDLQQDHAGYWQDGFQHLASFPFGHRREVFENQPGRTSRPRLALLVPQETDVVEMPTEPGVSGTIPAAVRALDGKRVSLKGYMLPVRVEDGLVRECLLLRNQSLCCFGRRPEINEWVVVKVQGKGVPSKMDTPVTISGTLRVGELFENGVFEGLYELAGEKITEN